MQRILYTIQKNKKIIFIDKDNIYENEEEAKHSFQNIKKVKNVKILKNNENEFSFKTNDIDNEIHSFQLLEYYNNI